MKKIQQRGFIALISAIIISAVLLSAAATLGASAFYSRFDALGAQYKRVSLGLAESCVSSALLRIAQNYGYTPVAGGDTIQIATDAQGQPETCVIEGVTYTSEVLGQKTATIKTQGRYRNVFSNARVTAIVQNPSYAPVEPLPTCALAVSAPSIPSGRQEIFSWGASQNAVSISLDHGIGSLSPVASGSTGPITVSGVGSITYTATAMNGSGGIGTCAVTITVTPPPPAPSCADSVMVLDRTGSLSSSDLIGERNAANALVDLYAGVSPFPLVGAGSFGGQDGSAASIPVGGQLSSAYSTVKSVISQITGSNSSVGSDLGAAITAAAGELNGSRHINGKQKVLIFVSDGLPNKPSSISGNTGSKSPTSDAQNGSGDAWSSGGSAYSDGGGDANDPVGEDDRHRFYNFDFPTIPTGATIDGIEAQADAWATDSGGGGTTNILTAGFGTGSTDSTFDESPSWTEGGNGAEKRASGNGNDSASPDGGRFAVMFDNGWICKQIDASALTSLGLSYYWRGDSDANSSSDDGIVEYRSGGSCTSSSGWNQLQNHDLRAWNSWAMQSAFTLPSSLNNSTFYLRFRANSGSNEYFRVDGVSLTGTGASATACQLNMDLSWNAGSNWTGEKTQTLSATETTYTQGGATDDWSTSHTWGSADFSNTNFRARVHAVDPGSACGDSAVEHLDWLRLKVFYTVPGDPSGSATAAATAAKSPAGSDGLPISIFSIHFGDASGQNFLGSLASMSTLPISNIASIARSGNVVTVTTAAPHTLAVNERIQISGVSNSGFNGTFTVTGITATTFTYSQSGSNASSSGGTVTPTNLFIAPTASQMSGIFQSIGQQVCPASAPQCSNTIDDDGDGLTDTADAACHTDGDASNSGSYDATDNDEWSAPAAPPAPLPPPPAPNVDISTWQEVPQ